VVRDKDGAYRQISSSYGIQFGLSESNLTLVESQGELSLKRTGLQIQNVGSSDSSRHRVEIENSNERDDLTERSSMKLSGWLEVEYDNGLFTVFVAGNDSNGETGPIFSLSARMLDSESRYTEEGRSVARSDAQMIDDSFGIVAVDAGSGYCTVTCEKGESDITCYNSGCSCRCVNKKPRCECLSNGQ